ncbi:3-dehydroquinate synthase [Flavobacterium sp. NKUCC04_CG]|uniref:3-dehydroquinate synthase n=1 Tax=Flavobacterium sp. NKUCC04_CG TaxID=2842121 RepID=UPI001C5ACDFE|nr:3-dehydroquinate synthase [Flavobacterium sp. NKUCC04_CG]MBW3517884.1 3-dehydroquinate synthase [Flavobacterium sp. NKUCC04_CG]
MKKIHSDQYDITFGFAAYDFLGNLLNNRAYSKIFVLTDSVCNSLCVPHFLSNLPTVIAFEIIEVETGEEFKTIDTAYAVWQALAELNADRNSVIITVGGGVITDLGGFVAALFKRGIDCINVPTSLLAMVDASVGGKTGIDVDGIKNQIGTFTNPQNVLIDVSFLETLGADQMRSGLAEMFKHGLIYDAEYWQVLQNLSALTTEDMEDLIYHSIQIKNEIVLQDPKEKGLRKILNFGHTLGHAVESYFLNSKTRSNILHGEAVAMGMILESYLSWQMGKLAADDYYSIKTVLFDTFAAVDLTTLEIEACLDWLQHDKKNALGIPQFVLLNAIGVAIRDQVVDRSLIIKAFEDYQS